MFQLHSATHVSPVLQINNILHYMWTNLVSRCHLHSSYSLMLQNWVCYVLHVLSVQDSNIQIMLEVALPFTLFRCKISSRLLGDKQLTFELLSII